MEVDCSDPNRVSLHLDATEQKALKDLCVQVLNPTREKLNVQLDKLDFDLDVLRVMVNVARLRLPKSKHDDEGYETMARILGVSSTAMRGFCHGRSAPALKTVIRLMAWVGYTDLADGFLTEEPQ